VLESVPERRLSASDDSLLLRCGVERLLRTRAHTTAQADRAVLVLLKLLLCEHLIADDASEITMEEEEATLYLLLAAEAGIDAHSETFSPYFFW
jgi:hypothetical protein